MTCEELEELAGALALDAALPEEVAAARAHLASCTRAHASVRELAATAAVLALAAEPMAPPAHLRERILAAARADLAPPDSTHATAQHPTHAPVPRPEPASLPVNVTPIRTGIWSRLARAPGWLAAAAMLLAALGLGAWNLQLQRDLDARDNRAAAQAQALDAVARGAVSTFAALADVGEARGILVRPENGRPVVVLTGLRRPEGAQVYQLWAIRGGQPQDIGIFRPDAAGRAAVELPDLSGAELVAITLEPRRMPQPTTSPILAAPLRTSSAAPRLRSPLRAIVLATNPTLPR